MKELEFLVSKDKYEKQSLEILKKEFPDEVEKLKHTIYMKSCLKTHISTLLKMSLMKKGESDAKKQSISMSIYQEVRKL